MYKLDLEKAEEPEIKLPTTAGSSIGKSKRVPEKHYFCFTDYAKALTVWITMNWKILKEMGIPDHLTCLLRNLYVGQEATVRTRHATMDWFKIGKGVRQGYILSPCLFNLYAESVQFSHSVVSNSLWPRGLQHARLPCSSPELAQTHVRWVSDAIQPSYPLLSPSPPASNLSQHQGLF